MAATAFASSPRTIVLALARCQPSIMALWANGSRQAIWVSQSATFAETSIMLGANRIREWPPSTDCFDRDNFVARKQARNRLHLERQDGRKLRLGGAPDKGDLRTPRRRAYEYRAPRRQRAARSPSLQNTPRSSCQNGMFLHHDLSGLTCDVWAVGKERRDYRMKLFWPSYHV
jgi:hypothetical protein